MLMQRLGRVVIRRRRWVLIAAALFFPLAGVLGGSVAEHLSAGGFADPAAESTKAADELAARFDDGTPNVLLLVTAKSGTVDDAAVAERGNELTDRLAKVPGVAEAASYWSLGNAPPLRGQDGRQALVIARIAGDEDEVAEVAEQLTPQFAVDDATVAAGVGGAGEVFRQITTQSEEDLTRAEALAAPVTLIALLLVFGSAVAAALPLGVGAFAVVGTFLVLRLFTTFTDVSIFALNLTTAMGLGLAIDYSLFVVSRYREELAEGRTSDAALLRTMHTAGRTVVFSAITVAISLGALLVFPHGFLRSFAYAGAGVVALAAIGAAFVLPAALSALGPRIEKGRLFKPRQKALEDGFWYRRARSVIRWPVPVAAVGVVFLLLLGVPFLGIEPSVVDDRVLPEDAPARRVHDDIRRNFASNEAAATAVVAASDASDEAVHEYALALSRIEGVARVDARTGFYIGGGRAPLPTGPLNERYRGADGTWLSVVPSVEPLSPEGERLVKTIRNTDAPFDVVAGGRAAELVDSKASLYRRLPFALVWIALATFVLLFLMVGSVLVPVKALLLNLLSLSATFGALVWIFQEGHLSSVLNFTPTGTISVFLPILLFCIAFGLSMDYEVFLLSRIKEDYDISRDNDTAVAVGLEHTGKIVTAAALLITIVFAAFTTARVSSVQVVGVGLGLAVLVDAFIIRTALVPAFMKIAGDLNWWAPRRLRRLHLRFGIWETEPLDIFDRVEEQRTRLAEFPIDGYDDLTVRELEQRLMGLDRGGLVAVAERERAGKGRKTVLAKVERLLERSG